MLQGASETKHCNIEGRDYVDKNKRKKNSKFLMFIGWPRNPEIRSFNTSPTNINSLSALNTVYKAVEVMVI